jgi:hypothetical protein
MSGSVRQRSKNRLSSADQDDILAEARRRFERCQTWETTARANALADIKFANGDSINRFQWDQDVLAQRAGRPCLTHNRTRQHNLQIVNDARQNKAQIKVTPVGGHATYEAAQIFSAIIRRIEYQSKAVDAYSTGIYHQVESGIGYVRVICDYTDEEGFDQEPFIRRIADPNTVYIDPDAKDYDKADMRFAFIFNDIPRERYDNERGDGDMPPPAGSTALDNDMGWNNRDHVREAEYWRRNERGDTLHKLATGATIRQSSLKPGELEAFRPHIIASREVSEPEVEWFRICGDRIEDHGVWPGRFIPIVPFIGEETVIDGIMDRKGHTRALKDAQRMYNYWNSAAVEQVALQTKIPYITPARAIEGFEQTWDSANTSNKSYLPYNDIDEANQPIQRPERAQAPQMAQAYIQGMMTAKEDMMMVSGQYQANFGEQSNERSGVAISQRQREGDNATYHFIDNQAKAIRQIGRILLDIIPKVYDVARVIKVIAEDGADSEVFLHPRAPQAHQHIALTQAGPQPLTPQQAQAMQSDPDQPDPRIIFNPTVGRYDVESDVGPAFATRRQEAFNALSDIIKASPDLVHVAGDLLFKSADFPLADELAERLKRGVPPQFLGGPPAAALQAQQQQQQQQAQFHQLMQAAQQKIISLEAQLKDKDDSNRIADYNAETGRLTALGKVDPMLVQMIARQLWENMRNTDIVPHLQNHADVEAALQPPAPAQEGAIAS